MLCIEALEPSDPRAEHALHAFMEEMSSRWLGRPATEDDLREAFREFPSDDLRPPDGLLLVAHRDGAVEGCAGLRLLDPRLAEVKRVWVSPAARRQGLGRRLMADIERRAFERGVRELRSTPAATSSRPAASMSSSAIARSRRRTTPRGPLVREAPRGVTRRLL